MPSPAQISNTVARVIPSGQATTRLVAHHFQSVLLATAQARFEGPAVPEETR